MHLDVEKIEGTDITESCAGDFCKELAIYAIRYIQSNIGQAG